LRNFRVFFKHRGPRSTNVNPTPRRFAPHADAAETTDQNNCFQETTMKTTKTTAPLFNLIAMSVITLFGVGAVATGTAVAAAAADTDSVLTVTVKYDDLDLSHHAGVDRLYGRIRRAAQTVCAPFEGRSLSETQHWTQCVDASIARAVADVHQPALAALHAAKTGNQQPARMASMKN
jgi:UrcA family protein